MKYVYPNETNFPPTLQPYGGRLQMVVPGFILFEKTWL